MTAFPAKRVYDTLRSAGGPARARALPSWFKATRALASLGVFLFVLCLASLAPSPLQAAAEVIPPAPANHFNDFARVVRPQAARQLNEELAGFEQGTSTQVVVAIYPHMESSSSIEDYAVRIFQAWGIGKKNNNNGVLLLVFSQDRTMRIQTGYGTEGALPDALAKQIIENEIVPNFQAGNFEAGLANGTRAIMAAVQGEYQGTGRTVKENRPGGQTGGAIGGIFFFVVVVMIILGRFGRRGTVYGRRGPRGIWLGGPPWGGGGGSSWGGGGGGGTFSGGGGSTGGGGASGRW